MSCKLLGFQKEAKFKILEHTRNGVIFRYFSEYWDAEIYRQKCDNKCEIQELK